MPENYATKADFERLEVRLESKIDQTQAQLKLEIERLEYVETTLLREFHKWAILTKLAIQGL